MVSFFYTFDYSGELEDGADLSQLQLHTRMFALADQYEIPRLGVLAAKKYSDTCTKSWSAQEFFQSLKDIYTTTPSAVRQLRETACTEIQGHLPEILEDDEVADQYEQVLDEIPEFVKDLLGRYIGECLHGHCLNYGPSQPMEVLQVRCKTCGRGDSGRKSYFR